MSEDEPSHSGGITSEDEEHVETLIAGRAKRITAGRNMSSLVNFEAHDDLALLFAEDEDDEEFAEVEEAVDGESAADMGSESSSEDEDQGSNGAGDDLEGEMELQKQARAERLEKKRKAQESLRLIALRKRVKIDPTPISTPAPRPKKKSERISWLPTPEDGPTRSSSRHQTMRNKELTHARLKDSEERRIRLIATMEEAARRKEKLKPRTKTQAERLAEAEKIERLNSKSLNRWEEMEKKKAEERRIRLEALQNRRLEGPVMCWWTGTAKWVNGRMARVGNVDIQQRPEKQETERKKKGRESTNHDLLLYGAGTNENLAKENLPQPPSVVIASTNPFISKSSLEDRTPTVKDSKVEQDPPRVQAEALSKHLPTQNESSQSPSHTTVGFYDSNQHYIPGNTMNSSDAAQESSTLPEGSPPPSAIPDDLASAVEPNSKMRHKEDILQQPAIEETSSAAPGSKPSQAQQLGAISGLNSDLPIPHPVNQERSTEASEAMDIIMTNTQSPVTKCALAMTPDPPSPVTTPLAVDPNSEDRYPLPGPVDRQQVTTNGPLQIRLSTTPPPPVVEYTGRNLLILGDFDDKTIQSREYSIYFNPKKPSKLTKITSHLCVITSLPAHYRDPRTALPFANTYAYRQIQRAAVQDYAWSSMLGCYVGPIGFAAQGVPERFLGDNQSEKGRSRVGGTDSVEANMAESKMTDNDHNDDPADHTTLNDDGLMEVDNI